MLTITSIVLHLTAAWLFAAAATTYEHNKDLPDSHEDSDNHVIFAVIAAVLFLVGSLAQMFT